jgi:hypothetical protein
MTIARQDVGDLEDALAHLSVKSGGTLLSLPIQVNQRYSLFVLFFTWIFLAPVVCIPSYLHSLSEIILSHLVLNGGFVLKLADRYGAGGDGGLGRS